MSYDIYIGEAVLDLPDPEYADTYRQIGARVESMTHPEAPFFPGDGMTGKGNSRHPSYSGWTNFVERHGLYDLFFGSRDVEAFMGKPARSATREDSLMHDYPGCAALRPVDLVEIRQARERHEAKAWPTAERIAGWDPELKPFDNRDGDPRYDADLARLRWLEWWVAWALANCEHPALYNR